MGLETDRFGKFSKIGKPSVGSVPFQTPGLGFPRSFRNSFLHQTAVAQILTSPPTGEASNPRPWGAGLVGTPGPPHGEGYALCTLRAGSAAANSRWRKGALSGGLRRPQPRAISSPAPGAARGPGVQAPAPAGNSAVVSGGRAW